MTRQLTENVATMSEMREPRKVLDRARGRPVAVMENARVVGYFVPAEAVEAAGGHRVATRDEVMAHLRETRAEVQPVLDYLKDK